MQMPLVAKNIIIKSGSVEKVLPATEPQNIHIEINTKELLEDEKIIHVDNDHKKVGKQSQYMLDMLTIDNE
jgi:hypothetical protein